jgi:hypothetical protein
MNRYDPGTPRIAFGIVAIAMTAITIGLLVVLPSQMESNGHLHFALAAIPAAVHAACDTDVIPACADVGAGDAPGAVSSPVRFVESPCKQPG